MSYPDEDDREDDGHLEVARFLAGLRRVPRYCPSCRMRGNDDSRLGRDVVHHLEGAPPEGLLAEVCEAAGHVFPVAREEEEEATDG